MSYFTVLADPKSQHFLRQPLCLGSYKNLMSPFKKNVTMHLSQILFCNGDIFQKNQRIIAANCSHKSKIINSSLLEAHLKLKTVF